VFDKDRTGFVGKGQIKYILTNLGEKMTEEEVDELFKSTIDTNNNEIDYRGKPWALRPCCSYYLLTTSPDRVRQDYRRELIPQILQLSFLESDTGKYLSHVH
jgi:hypothetical protein